MQYNLFEGPKNMGYVKKKTINEEVQDNEARKKTTF